MSRTLDRLGVVGSSLCLIHCMATPLLVVWLPLVASERFEGALAVALVAFATLSVGLSLARGRLLPAAPYTLGLAALAAMHAADVAEGSALELVGAAVAALSMITTHLMSLSARSRESADERGGPP